MNVARKGLKDVDFIRTRNGGTPMIHFTAGFLIGGIIGVIVMAAFAAGGGEEK